MQVGCWRVQDRDTYLSLCQACPMGGNHTKPDGWVNTYNCIMYHHLHATILYQACTMGGSTLCTVPPFTLRGAILYHLLHTYTYTIYMQPYQAR